MSGRAGVRLALHRAFFFVRRFRLLGDRVLRLFVDRFSRQRGIVGARGFAAAFCGRSLFFGGLRRVDGHRTIGLNVSPPKELSLGQAIELLKAEVEPAVRADLPADGSVHYEGNAGSLREALSNMAQNLAIALIALFLLLAALFRSVKDSLYVILTIPLASFGGVLALVLLRLFTPQTLDLLTMVGFVVLMGLVVNNAILLVDQARNEIRAGATVRSAVESALATRTRPIMLTTLTTLFGMLPLVLVPGPGSVLYRGLGTVLVGGMAVNSVFTLLLLPTLLRLIEKPDTEIVTETDKQPMEAV